MFWSIWTCSNCLQSFVLSWTEGSISLCKGRYRFDKQLLCQEIWCKVGYGWLDGKYASFGAIRWKGTIDPRPFSLSAVHWKFSSSKQDCKQAILQLFLISTFELKSVSTTSGGKSNDYNLSSVRRTPVHKTIKIGTVQATNIWCLMCQLFINSGSNNVVLNNHIDLCLNSSTIQAVIQEESMATQRSKKLRLNYFFCQKWGIHLEASLNKVFSAVLDVH